MPATGGDSRRIEHRLFYTGMVSTVLAAVLFGALAGLRAGLSCVIGGALAAISLGWLRRTIGMVLVPQRTPPIRRFLAGYVFRLMLIPLALYAMLRLRFFSLPAAVAGIAAFYMAVLVEGIRQALGGRS